MKLKSYFTILLVVAGAAAKAQQVDTAQLIAHYKFTHVRDTNNRDKPLTENMILLVGRNASVYKSYDRKLRDEEMRRSVTEQINSGSTKINVKSSGGPLGANVDYYQYPNSNKFFSREKLVNNYVVEETLPALSWKITADTSTIKGLQCQKATTHFKGRDYTAWFCADLPYRVGPWKLNGLPGLIVDAYDAKKEVVFKFDGLEKIDPNTKAVASQAGPPSTPGHTIILGGMDDGNRNANVIALPANAIKATPKELDGLKEIMRKDPQAFFQSQMAAMQGQMGGSGRSFSIGGGAGGGSVTNIQSVNIQAAPGGTPAVTNNPIELPEKGDRK